MNIIKAKQISGKDPYRMIKERYRSYECEGESGDLNKKWERLIPAAFTQAYK